MNKWEMIQGIYIHIPFCLQKCQYCDFTSFPQVDGNQMVAYTEQLCRHINYYRKTMPINPRATIYFGGGTPSLLPLSCLEQIVSALKAKGLWEYPAEATIEVNPGTVTAAKLKAYRALGFDRISMGIQSLHDKELKAMGRIHNKQEAVDALTMAKEAGFKRINGDLIFGYPGQTVASVKSSVEGLVQLGLKHISVYGLSVEKGTPLEKNIKKGSLRLPEDDAVGDMYDFIAKYLPEHGLKHYEISNFAKTGEEARHNLVYWHYLPYLGFGIGAVSFTGKERYTGPLTMKEYLAGKLAEKEKLTSAIQLEECIFMNLRTLDGVNIEEIKERFAIDFGIKYSREIAECEAQKLVEWAQDNKILRLTPLGMQFGNRVFEKFM